MKFKTIQEFSNYSENALLQVITRSVGKPCYKNGEKVGKIINAKRVDGSNSVEFEVEMEVK